MALPAEIERLMWDIDPRDLDLQRHADYVLERVMTRGGWAAMQWLRAAYSTERIADFLRKKGDRIPPRERAYWCLIAGVDLPQARGGGRPPWLGA